MSFFDRQDQARRATRILVVYFIALLAVIVLALNVPSIWFTQMMLNEALGYRSVSFKDAALSWATSVPFFFMNGIGVGSVIFGTLLWHFRVGKDGRKVAAMVGAKLVRDTEGQPALSRLQNIVEEMSLASGTPMPLLYVSPDTSINAFVAGGSPQRTVLVVTQGALDQLSRDELQGVIGHEYSHLLNQDVIINMRLLGVVAGLFLLSDVGRLMTYSGSPRRDNSRLALVGVAFLICGAVGAFFGRLIQSAISRQREYLADASAVQFTRSSTGIANALFKISAGPGSTLKSAHASDVRHLCFADSASGFLSLTDTHPPTDHRIKAIAPDFDFVQAQAEYEATARLEKRQAETGQSEHFAESFAGLLPGMLLSELAGTVKPAHLTVAQERMGRINADLRNLARHPGEVVSLIYGAALSLLNAIERNAGLKVLEEQEDPVLIRDAITTCATIDRDELCLFDLLLISLPALRQLEEKRRLEVFDKLLTLVEIDNTVSDDEKSLLLVYSQCLEPESLAGRLPSLEKAQERILAFVAMAGNSNPGFATSSFFRGLDRLGLPDAVLTAPTFHQLFLATTVIRKQSATIRAEMLDTVAMVANDDNEVTAEEELVLRALAASFECPLPILRTK